MASLDGAVRVKVPVDQVAATAYRAVFGRLGHVLDLGWLPMLVLLAVELVPGLVTTYLWPGDASADTPNSIALGDVAQSLVAALCLTAFWVRWQHAQLTAGRETLSPRRFLLIWVRLLAYALPFYAATLGLMTALAFIGMGDDGEKAAWAMAFTGAAGVAVSLILARCSLVFPAVGGGQPMGVLGAWRRMRGNTWRFVATNMLVVAPVMVLASVIVELIRVGAHLEVEEMLTQPLPLGVFLMFGVINTVFAVLLVALGATILAEFYRRLVLNGRAGP